MKVHNFIAVTAIAAAAAFVSLPAAQAQTFTVNGSVSGSAPTFTYSYVVTPVTGSLGVISFNFSDGNVTAGTAPASFTNVTPAGLTGTGIFMFLSGAAGGTTTATTFTFTSPDNIGGTLGATNLSTAAGSSGTASVVATGAAPAAAPEPSQTAALGLGVLGLTGMVFTARRRKMLVN